MAEGTREPSRREQVDIGLETALRSAHKNYQEVCALQGALFGGGTDIQPRPERPARSGWLGEVQDKLGELNGLQADVSRVLQGIAEQLSTQTPTPHIG